MHEPALRRLMEQRLHTMLYAWLICILCSLVARCRDCGVVMHLSMFSPGGGGEGGVDSGNLIKLVLPRVGNLTGKFVPLVGRYEYAE